MFPWPHTSFWSILIATSLCSQLKLTLFSLYTGLVNAVLLAVSTQRCGRQFIFVFYRQIKSFNGTMRLLQWLLQLLNTYTSRCSQCQATKTHILATTIKSNLFCKIQYQKCCKLQNGSQSIFFLYLWCEFISQVRQEWRNFQQKDQYKAWPIY